MTQGLEKLNKTLEEIMDEMTPEELDQFLSAECSPNCNCYNLPQDQKDYYFKLIEEDRKKIE